MDLQQNSPAVSQALEARRRFIGPTLSEFEDRIQPKLVERITKQNSLAVDLEALIQEKVDDLRIGENESNTLTEAVSLVERLASINGKTLDAAMKILNGGAAATLNTILKGIPESRNVTANQASQPALRPVYRGRQVIDAE